MKGYLLIILILIINTPISYLKLVKIIIIYLWISLITIILIESYRFYKEQLKRSKLELYLLSTIKVRRVLSYKIIKYWCISILPLIIISLFIMILLDNKEITINYIIKLIDISLITCFIGILINTLNKEINTKIYISKLVIDKIKLLLTILLIIPIIIIKEISLLKSNLIVIMYIIIVPYVIISWLF